MVKKKQNKGQFLSINRLMAPMSLEDQERRGLHSEYCQCGTWECRKALYNKIKIIFLFSLSTEQKN